MLRSKSTESCKPSSMPNSLVLPSSTEAIMTWIMTIGGRASSCSMIPRTSSKNLRRGAQDQAVGDRLGDDHHFAFDLLEGAGQPRPGLLQQLSAPW